MRLKSLKHGKVGMTNLKMILVSIFVFCKPILVPRESKNASNFKGLLGKVNLLKIEF